MGHVPEHWEIRKLRHLLRPTSERKRPDLPLLSVVRERGVILRDVEDRDENHNFVPDDLTNYKVVRAGQFAMNKMKAWQGSYGVSSFDGLVSPAYFVFSLDGVDGDFFHRAIRSRGYVPFFAHASDGVRIGQWDLSQERMKEIPFCVPPLSEQAAIVRYLDHVDRRISRYIRAKQRLIALLEEEKQVIIHRAVTRGLDPDVPLKPSGVEWLGDVPEHWNFESLGLIGSFFKGSGGTKDDEDEEGVPCVRYGDIYTQHQYFIRQARASIPEESAAKYTPIRYGDILFAGSGETIEEIGKSAVNLIDGPAYCGGDVIAFRPSIEADATFLGYAADSPTSVYQKACMGRGVTVMHIYSQELRRLLLPLPPLGEQRAIARYIDQATASIDFAIDRARHEIELLREYRTRLIADVVTGKLDVREVAANLPEVAPADLEDIIEIDDVVADELDAELEKVAP